MKNIVLLLIFVSFSINAQDLEKKDIDMPDQYRELFLALKEMDAFRSFIIPQTATEYYSCDLLQYIQFRNEQYEVKIMPDEEIRISVIKPKNGIRSKVIYLRFLNGKAFGYDLITYKDGHITTQVYRAPYVGVYDYDFQPEKK